MTVTEFYFKNNHFHHLVASGHSGYSNAGSDIVCSAITTSIFTILNVFNKLNIEYKLEQDEKKGYVFVEVSLQSEVIDNIIEGLIDTLRNIELDYPKNLKITLKEEK